MKKTLILTLIVGIILTSVSCRKKEKAPEEEVPVAKTYTEEEYNELQAQLTQLENELSLYDGRYKTLKAFKKKNVIQAGNWSYNKIADKVVLNNSNGFEKKAPIQPIGLISSIHLGDTLSLKADSWQVKTNTSELQLTIPDHAYGRISMYKFIVDDGDEFYPEVISEEYIKPYFEANNVIIKDKGRNIYVNNNFIGQELSGTISIYDSTTNGMQLTIPALQILEEDLLDSYRLGPDSEVNVELKLNGDKEINATYRVGIGNAGGTIIYYEFLTLDNSGKIHVDDLLSSITLDKSPLYLR